ncbi:DUF5710 domain-containing protein [Peribacillus frigoritolerans]|uniref:DUF5710 domain-containing protein n=1 Tax=Peribacillus frigoritolerans TaxID=450367 RepID=UPI003B8B1785
MARINLKVPFKDKDIAKSLGAKWDKDKKVWFTSYGGETQRFYKWLLPIKEEDIDLKADYFYIAETTRQCWECKRKTKVFCFLLESYCFIDAESEFDESENWKSFWIEEDYPSFISEITWLNEKAQLAMLNHTERFRASKSEYIANHCDHCDALQGDFYLHEEPGIAFCPVNEKEIKRIKLYKVDEPFEAAGCHSWSSIFEDYDVINICLQKPRKGWFWGK